MFDSQLSPRWNWSRIGLTYFEHFFLFRENVLDVLETTVLERWHEKADYNIQICEL